MTWMTLTRVGMGSDVGGATSSSGANPQLQFFENFPGHLGAASVAISNRTLSLHAVNIPLSISFNNVVALINFSLHTGSGQSGDFKFGLYSLNASTLSLANSANGSYGYTTNDGGSVWVSFVTSATQNITPGTWYFGMVKVESGGHSRQSILGNSSINPANAVPGGFLMGRMTASVTDMPASIATSDLDITGSDATRQPYIILTA